MSDTNAKFVGNLIIRGKFKCLTGLHIGGSKEKLEIGGVDSPVVRDPRTRYPYVPGSSLKGKLRSLLEYGTGVVPQSGDVSTDADIVRLFGIGVDEKEAASKKTDDPLYNIGPSRLIVRDCHPTQKTVDMWKKLDTDLLYTEYKSENGINRVTSAANPRFIERVAKDSEFEFEMIYTQYELNNGADHAKEIENDLANLRMAVLMLEHNFLGKSGSRGYGRVEFRFEDLIYLSQNDYKTGANMAKATAATSDFEKLKTTGDVAWAIKAKA
jgi:CRISPR-associated protein Csm3